MTNLYVRLNVQTLDLIGRCDNMDFIRFVPNVKFTSFTGDYTCDWKDLTYYINSDDNVYIYTASTHEKETEYLEKYLLNTSLEFQTFDADGKKSFYEEKYLLVYLGSKVISADNNSQTDVRHSFYIVRVGRM